MKSILTSEGTPRNAPSQANQTPDKPVSPETGNIAVGRPFPAGYRSPTQAGRSPVRGSDEWAGMKSQLG